MQFYLQKAYIYSLKLFPIFSDFYFHIFIFSTFITYCTIWSPRFFTYHFILLMMIALSMPQRLGFTGLISLSPGSTFWFSHISISAASKVAVTARIDWNALIKESGEDCCAFSIFSPPRPQLKRCAGYMSLYSTSDISFSFWGR